MKRRSFTLLELLLVLALISVISGIGVAGYQRQHERAKFRSGVVGIQIDLNRTRILAMRSGQAYYFRFIPGTGIYEIAPLTTLQEAIYRMTDDSADALADPLGGSLSSDVGEFASYTGVGNDLSDPYGFGGEIPSDNLFSEENIRADMTAAGALQDETTTTGFAALGGSLGNTTSTYSMGAGMDYSLSSTSGAGLSSSGGLMPLDVQSPLLEAPTPGITIREMNSEERQLGATENTIAWRVNLDGLVLRKMAQGDVIFTFSRLSDSTPTNLKNRRPGGVQDSSGTQGAFDDMQGEDLGSRLGGSLRSIPVAESSDALGGGLTAQTSGVSLYENALTGVEEQTAPVSVWSDPVVFYPNGRASTVVFGLAGVGKFPYYSEIGVRGMTGYARISSIRSTPEGYTPGETALTQEQLFRMTNPGVAYSGETTTGLSGGALDSTSTGLSGSDAALSGGALGGGLDALSGLGAGDSGTTGFTPNYGSTERRSGYNFGGAGTVDTASNAGAGGVAGSTGGAQQIPGSAFDSLDATAATGGLTSGQVGTGQNAGLTGGLAGGQAGTGQNAGLTGGLAGGQAGTGQNAGLTDGLAGGQAGTGQNPGVTGDLVGAADNLPALDRPQNEEENRERDNNAGGGRR